MIAITLVAAALCADRAVIAAPVLRPQMTNVASRFVSRLSARFQRAVRVMRVYQNRSDEVLAAEKRGLVCIAPACFGMRLPLTLLRLPPPLA